MTTATQVRLGISVSRKVGGAVERNAVKRGAQRGILVARREAARAVTTSSSSLAPTPPAWWSARAPAAVAAALEELISEAGLAAEPSRLNA